MLLLKILSDNLEDSTNPKEMHSSCKHYIQQSNKSKTNSQLSPTLEPEAQSILITQNSKKVQAEMNSKIISTKCINQLIIPISHQVTKKLNPTLYSSKLMKNKAPQILNLLHHHFCNLQLKHKVIRNKWILILLTCHRLLRVRRSRMILIRKIKISRLDIRLYLEIILWCLCQMKIKIRASLTLSLKNTLWASLLSLETNRKR